MAICDSVNGGRKCFPDVRIVFNKKKEWSNHTTLESTATDSRYITNPTMTHQTIWTINGDQFIDVTKWDDSAIMTAFDADLLLYQQYHDAATAGRLKAAAAALPRPPPPVPLPSPPSAPARAASLSSANTTTARPPSEAGALPMAQPDVDVDDGSAGGGRKRAKTSAASPRLPPDAVFQEWQAQWNNWYADTGGDPAKREDCWQHVLATGQPPPPAQATPSVANISGGTLGAIPTPPQSGGCPALDSTAIRVCTDSMLLQWLLDECHCIVCCWPFISPNVILLYVQARVVATFYQSMADEALADLLMSWYHAGYAAGRYKTLADIRKP